MGTTKKEYKHIITAFTLHLTEEKLQFIILHEKKTGKFYFCINVGLCFASSVNLPLPVLPGFEDGFSLRDLAEQL